MHRKTTSEKVEETGCYGYLKKNEKITNEIRIFNFGDKTTFLIIKQQKVAIISLERSGENDIQ